jgi:hypothetical protein
VVLDEELLRQARESAARWVDAQHQAEVAKADYHHAVRRLHFGGARLREIAEALEISHQRVHQIVESSGGSTGSKPRKKAGADLACTFCGTSKDEVVRLIVGPGVSICDDCVALGQRVVSQPQLLETPHTRLDPVVRGSNLDCSFCGKSASNVDRLVAGPGVRICDECLALSAEIIAAQSAQSGQEGKT